MPSLHRPRSSNVHRYQRKIPGERVHLDTMKVRTGCIQYTVIYDCSRFLFEDLFSIRKSLNTILFVESLFEALAFPVQYIKTDRGREFMALDVQFYLRERCIYYRSNRLAEPHPNGKVEWVHWTMRDEPCSTLPRNHTARILISLIRIKSQTIRLCVLQYFSVQ